MFLPGRSVDQEKAVRQAAYKNIEEWSKGIIDSPPVQQACLISVQEVQCGDPNCSPIDTVVTLTFDS
jgi:hypothetical protein